MYPNDGRFDIISTTVAVFKWFVLFFFCISVSAVFQRKSFNIIDFKEGAFYFILFFFSIPICAQRYLFISPQNLIIKPTQKIQE